MLLQTSLLGNPNVGIFAKSSDRFCLLGLPAQEQKFEQALKVPVLRASLGESGLVGIFCVVNSHGILLSKLVTPGETAKILALAKEFGVQAAILQTRYTAIGNLIACNDHGALVSELLSPKEREKVEDALGVEVVCTRIGNSKLVGACCVANSKGCLLHRDASEEEISLAENLLKVEADIGTLNFGSPWVGACCVANSFGVVLGETTTPPELVRLQEALKLL